MRVSRQIRSRFSGLSAASLLAGALLALPGCGFRPMDARDPADVGMPVLAQIEVGRIPDRVGQILRTELRNALNPTGDPAPHAYNLKVVTTETIGARGIRNDDSEIRIDHTINAQFNLSTLGSEGSPSKLLLQGQSQAVARGNRPDALYAAHVSDEEATQRAARLVAEDIARQVRLYFRNPDRYPLPKPVKSPAVDENPARPARP
jgi:hypothetical protein